MSVADRTIALYTNLAALGTLTVVSVLQASRVEAALHRLSPLGIYEAQGPTLTTALLALTALVEADTHEERA